MRVYAVVKKTTVLMLFKTYDSAEEYAAEYNRQFPKGARAVVVVMVVSD